MAREDRGVLFYASGAATIGIHFANGEVCCRNCPFAYVEYKESDLQRARCRLLRDEIIPHNCAKFGVLPNCPIEMTGEFEPPTFEPAEV